MSLIYLIVLLAVVGLILWIVNQYVPMPPMFKQILNVVVIIAIVLWLAVTFLGDGRISF